MRKVIVLEHISIDGVIQAPGGPEEDPSDGFAYGGWAGGPYADEIGGAALRKQMNLPFDLLLGRKTFDIWEPFWPKHADEWRASARRPSMSPRIPGCPANGSRRCF